MDEPVIGEIRLAAFDRIPVGWASCDGQVLAISEHRALFDVIGARYGGDGRRTFALPDLRGRVALHADGDYPLGASGGSARHSLTIAELPAHHHELLLAAPVTSSSGTSDGIGSYVASGLLEDAAEWAGADSAGIGSGHDNMQPYLGLVFMIALVGQSPARS